MFFIVESGTVFFTCSHTHTHTWLTFNSPITHNTGTEENNQFTVVMMGQKQFFTASRELERVSKIGGCLVLADLHLLSESEKEQLAESYIKCSSLAKEEFRCFFLSSRMNEVLVRHSLKISGIPSLNMKASVQYFWSLLPHDKIQESERSSELSVFALSLCIFHSHLLGLSSFRRRSSMNLLKENDINESDFHWSFSMGKELLESIPSGGEIPWHGLRYIVGEIVYGSRLSSEFDLRAVESRLEGADSHGLLAPSVLKGSSLLPGLRAPNVKSVDSVEQYVNKNFPPQSAEIFGMHPSSYCTTVAESRGRVLEELEMLVEIGQFLRVSLEEDENTEEEEKKVEEDVVKNNDEDEAEEDDDEDLTITTVMKSFRDDAKEAVAKLLERVPSSFTQDEFEKLRRKIYRFLRGLKPEREEIVNHNVEVEEQEEGKEEEEVKKEEVKEEEDAWSEREDEDNSTASSTFSEDDREDEYEEEKNEEEKEQELNFMSDSDDDEDAMLERRKDAHKRGPYMICLLLESSRLVCILDKVRSSLKEAKLALNGVVRLI